MKRFLGQFLVGAACLCASQLASAQTEAASALIATVQREGEWFCSISAPRTTQSGIVQQLARGMGIEVEGLELISPTALVTVELRDRPIPQALDWMLAASNLRAKWRTGVLQIQAILPDSPTPDELRDCALAAYTGALRSFPDPEAGAAAAFAKASIFERRGNLAQAIAGYDSLVRAYPQAAQAPEALMRGARQLFQQGDFEGAGAHYADLLRLTNTGPFLLEARVGFASSMAHKGEFRTALRLIAALDTSSPALTRRDMHERLLVRARCVLGDGNPAGARALLRESENGGLEPELEADFYELSARSIPGDAPPEYAAIAWMEHAKRATGPARAQAAAEAARLAHLSGDELGTLVIDRWAQVNGAGEATHVFAAAAREALGLDSQALTTDPTADRMARAERLMHARLWAEAGSAFAQLREQAPPMDESARMRMYTGLARCLDGQDRVDDAITMLREGLELVTDAAARREFYMTAASIFEARGKLDDAIAAYRGEAMSTRAIKNFAVCALLCVPALALRGDEKQTLREDLSHTESALATFTEIQRQLVAGDSKAVEKLLAAAEAGPLDAAQAELQLAELRTRINALQEILDARAVWAGETAPTPAVIETSMEVPLPPAIATTVEATLPVNDELGSKVAFESPGFVADRARLGRACWRGGRYQEGVAALEPLAGAPTADYWRARCLEKLSRNAEALELYKHVIEIAGDSPEGKSAREDSEFLEWSIGHGLVKTP